MSLSNDRNSFPLELSPKIRKGRYVHFSSAADTHDRIFIVGYEECAPDYAIERSRFPFWTLEFIADGQGNYNTGKQPRRLRHGALFTYGPDVPHQFNNDNDRPFRKYFLVKNDKQFPSSWRQAGLAPGRILQLGSAAPIIAIFDQILNEGQKIDAQTSQVVSSLHEILLALIIRHAAKASGDSSSSRKVYDLAMEILQREYRNLHALSDLATLSGYSSEYLCRVFKKHHGASPYQVLLQRKMSTAWLLLREGQLQVSAVANELGYEDPLHFSRVFHKIMGCAPSSVNTDLRSISIRPDLNLSTPTKS